MREEAAPSTGLVKRMGSTLTDHNQPYMKRVAAGGGLAAIPAAGLIGGAVGVQALNGIDPGLVAGVGHHLAFGADVMTPMAGPLGWAVGLGAMVAMEARSGHQHPLQRPVHAGLKKTAIGSSALTAGALLTVGGIDVVDALAHTHAAAGAAGGFANAAAATGIVAVSAAGLTKLWGIGLKKQPPKPSVQGPNLAE